MTSPKTGTILSNGGAAPLPAFPDYILIGRSVMAKISPYHTDSPEYPPKHREVHHDHDDCSEGKKIESKHRKPGTGYKPRCSECQRLG
jgi:hypothetical protein